MSTSAYMPAGFLDIFLHIPPVCSYVLCSWVQILIVSFPRHLRGQVSDWVVKGNPELLLVVADNGLSLVFVSG